VSQAAPHSATAARTVAIADVLALTKPRITAMVLVTAAGGFLLAPGAAPVAALVTLLLGTGVLVGAANALNMYLERDIDGRMARTRHRPLPDGRLDPALALALGVAGAFAAVPLLSFAVNPLTGMLGVVALLSYVLVYTPLKQRTAAAVWVGAVPGAMGPLMGWTAVTARLDTGALALFAVMFLWQVPHFHAIALFREDDYAQAGLKTLPGERGVACTKNAILLYLVLQVAVSLTLAPLGVGGVVTFTTAAVLGLAYVACALVGFGAATATASARAWARRLFFASLVYLPVLFGVLVLDGCG
jgi:protoheme IX farnesyltransferase